MCYNEKEKERDFIERVTILLTEVEFMYFCCFNHFRGLEVKEASLCHSADDEYFFLENETKISKVAPDGWKKGQILSFLTFLRVKYFVDDISFIL